MTQRPWENAGQISSEPLVQTNDESCELSVHYNYVHHLWKITSNKCKKKNCEIQFSYLFICIILLFEWTFPNANLIKSTQQGHKATISLVLSLPVLIYSACVFFGGSFDTNLPYWCCFFSGLCSLMGFWVTAMLSVQFSGQ